MRSFSHGLNSRSSSAALSAPKQSNIQDGISDDMTIAQGLLNNSKLQRVSSFTSMSIGPQIRDNASGPTESSEPNDLGRRRDAIRSSKTWTSSSGDVPAYDDIEDRRTFVNEYNRLAKKHGVRILIVEDYDGSSAHHLNASGKSGSWFSRKILRRTSSTQSVKSDRNIKHRRSVSDLSLRLKLKKDSLKDKDVQELVRLCGSSLLYLPTEYAPSSLAVPTCFRATAQYLVQHAPTTRGIFRIPGSHSIVSSLYNHYCDMDVTGQLIAGTVRCPTLPEHIRCDVHDVASAFKKFLSGLPGGILGSLPLFDALVSIQYQLHGDPELTRTKQSKVRARLIALAISTLRSRYRRELICSVFGLLCMIGRAAETTRREDDRGRPLPTSDLMGYGPLGIIFGPLLVGDMLENYTMRLANPHGGLVLLPISPAKSRKEKHKEKYKKSRSNLTEDSTQFNTHVDKIKVANGITEMLITHWRDVVRHMRNLSALQIIGGHKSLGVGASRQPFLRPSASESFALRKPPDWENASVPFRSLDKSVSPTPARRNSGLSEGQFDRFSDSLKVRKQRQKPRPMSSQTLSRIISKNPLSPTVEEHTLEDPLRQNHNRGSIKTTSINPAGSSDKDIEQPLTAVASPSLIGKESLSEAEMKTSLTKAMSPLARQGQTQQSFFEADIKLPRATARPLATETSVEDITRVKAKRATPPKNTQPKFQRDSSDKESEPPISNLAVIPPRSKGLSYGNCQPYPGHFKAGTRGTKDTPGLDRSPSTSPKQHTDPREPQQIAPSASHQLSPEITMSRASSRVLESRVSSHARRIAASEPGQRLTLPVRSHRTSKSTLDDSRRRSARAGASQFGSSKDPLTRVSREEDIASLATLARALDVLDKSTEADVKLGIADDSRSNNDSLVVHAPAYRQPIAADAQSGSQASAIRHGPPNIHAPSSDSKKLPNSERIIPQERQEHGTVSSLGQKSITPNNKSTVNPTSPKTPQQRQVVSSTKGNYGPPRGNVKALAAKFNTADSPPSVPPAAKSPTKSLRMDTQSRFESPKDNLVAPYTTNPPSPTRSQKSGISDKTPRSVRNLMPVDRNSSRTAGSTPAKESSAVKVSGSDEHASPIKDSSLNKKSTPCRVLKSSLKDPTPLRPVPKSIEGNSVCLASTLVNSSSQRSVSLKPVNISAASDVRISATFIYPAPLKRVQASAPMKVPTNMLGGPAGSINFGTVMPRPDPPPVAHHISFARPQSAGAVVEKTDIPNSQPLADDTNPVPGPIGPVAIPAPGRSNSMLHGQIRSLQRQLIAKDEELRQLRQQLDTRGNLDIGTLSEHLMKAKREIQTWKARAEVAEKQVEVMTKLSSRSSSRQVKALNQSFQSSANYSEDGAVVADRIRRALHGMDGAASERGTSEESSDTVIRDIREAVTGSEYSIWMEQTMNSLEDAVPYKLE